MITFDQFVAKYTGVGIDTDGYYGYQCMDLMHKYCQEVLGLQDLRILAASNAKSVYLNFNNVFGHELFEKIDNTPTGVPLKGDIVFYGNYPDGHVDVFIQGDVNSYRSFSQNLPTGSLSNTINHPNYANVLGWLRYKIPPVVSPVVTDDTLIPQIENKSVRDIKNELLAGRETIKSLNVKIQNAKSALN